MNVSKQDLGEILAGNTDECRTNFVAGNLPKPGEAVPVRVKGGRPRCWVFPVEVWPHIDGGYVVRFVRAPAPHTPRLLARTGRAHLEGASKGQSRSKTQRRTPSEVTVRRSDGTEEVVPPSVFPKPPRRSEGEQRLDSEQHDLGYASSPFRALGDEPECVPEDWQKDFSEPRSRRDALVRLERVAARRVERWKRKRERKRAA